MFLCFSMCIGWALLFSHEVVSNFSWSHELQHARLPCPALSFGVCSDLCPLSRWFHLTISSSAAPFSSGPQSFPASGSFSVIWLFASGGQIIGASASVLPINIQSWFPLGLTGLISLLSKGLSRVFFSTTRQKFQCLAFFLIQLSHPYITTGKSIALSIWTFLAK